MFELNNPLTPNALRYRFLLLHLHSSALWNEVGSSRQLSREKARHLEKEERHWEKKDLVHLCSPACSKLLNVEDIVNVCH